MVLVRKIFNLVHDVMGGRVSKHNDLLDGSEWIRTVVQNHQKSREGVSGFEKFSIEPGETFIGDPDDNVQRVTQTLQDGGIWLRRVSVTFKNAKDHSKQEVFWIVKAAIRCSGVANFSVPNLSHEIKVYISLLPEVTRFLSQQRNPRAKHLLNIPEYIFHERKCQDQCGTLIRCHLVLEDVGRAKNCRPVRWSEVESGILPAQFRVYLGTLAQFHAVGLAFNVSRRCNDPLLDTFPFLHRNKRVTFNEMELKERERCLNMYEKLLKYYQKRAGRSRSKAFDLDCWRRMKLVSFLKTRASEIMEKPSDYGQLKGLCLGPVQPTEIMFQYDRSTSVLENRSYEQGHPICAAVTTCHRVHYADIVRELTLCFFSLANPAVRDSWMVSMIQTYCHVITSTLELLDVDWVRQFKVNFPTLVKMFQDAMPQAIIKAIVMHMKMTDPKELDKLLQSQASERKMQSQQNKPTHKHKDDINLDHAQPPLTSFLESTEQHFNIPLTENRIDFLIRLTDSVTKIM